MVPLQIQRDRRGSRATRRSHVIVANWPRVIQERLSSGPGVLQAWFKSGSGAVQLRFEAVAQAERPSDAWFTRGSAMVHAWFSTCSGAALARHSPLAGLATGTAGPASTKGRNAPGSLPPEVPAAPASMVERPRFQRRHPRAGLFARARAPTGHYEVAARRRAGRPIAGKGCRWDRRNENGHTKWRRALAAPMQIPARRSIGKHTIPYSCNRSATAAHTERQHTHPCVQTRGWRDAQAAGSRNPIGASRSRWGGHHAERCPARRSLAKRAKRNNIASASPPQRRRSRRRRAGGSGGRAPPAQEQQARKHELQRFHRKRVRPLPCRPRRDELRRSRRTSPERHRAPQYSSVELGARGTRERQPPQNEENCSDAAHARARLLTRARGSPTARSSSAVLQWFRRGSGVVQARLEPCITRRGRLSDA